MSGSSGARAASWLTAVIRSRQSSDVSAIRSRSVCHDTGHCICAVSYTPFCNVGSTVPWTPRACQTAGKKTGQVHLSRQSEIYEFSRFPKGTCLLER